MDEDHEGDLGGLVERQPPPRTLPDDLPRSLDDRKNVPLELPAETEIYDAWQGQSQFLTAPVLAKPILFRSLSLEDRDDDFDIATRPAAVKDNDGRLMEMLAAQASHREGTALQDEDEVAKEPGRQPAEKKDILQKALTMAASNGDVMRIERILGGQARQYVDLDAPDDEGTTPLIYASCFGHESVVMALVEAGANVNRQDRNQWSALMWAMTNRHKGIVKALLDHGASPEVKSSSGRTAFDFMPPDSEMSDYLHDSGYNIGSAGISDDFYNPGFSQDRFEEEMAENEMRRRMMMESARDLEVDLGNVGIDDKPESPDDFAEDSQQFDWNRCQHDQMFVFQESELNRILDILITNMTPQRTPSQKPVPANMIFLGARYAYYHASHDLLAKLLLSAMDRINSVVETRQGDMTILAFWISNATLLLHYLKKDGHLASATSEFQLHLAELINEIFILIIRDAERRMDKHLDPAMLEHETIPGFEDIAFQHEWKLFKRKNQVKEEPLEKRYRPPSPKAKAKPSPRNVTSILSSTLFVLDLYDIHSVITAQILAQLLYWLGAELFNRIMSNRKYLARTKAMQIRMNVSSLEEWARANNRQPEHYENGSMTLSGQSTIDAARRHLAPLVQLLQWLQCFSSLAPDDLEALVGTVQQLPRLSPQQLVHSVRHYRLEVGEKGLPKSALRYLENLQRESALRRQRQRAKRNSGGSRPSTPIGPASSGPPAPPQRQQHGAPDAYDLRSSPASQRAAPSALDSPSEADEDDDNDAPEHLLIPPAVMLPFVLPTSTDMLVSYGAGFGGLNKDRERKYIPTVPPEFLVKLDPDGGRGQPAYGERDWEDEVV